MYSVAHAKYMDFVFIGSISGVCAYWLIYLHFKFNVALCLLTYSKLSGFGFFGQVKLVVYCCLGILNGFIPQLEIFQNILSEKLEEHNWKNTTYSSQLNKCEDNFGHLLGT